MSLQKFFSPKSVAVVGASRTFGKAGNVILLNLLNLGYEGRIYPVNPRADTIFELKCYPTVSSIPEVVDVAVIATPSIFVPEIMRDIQAKGVTNVVIISSGFSEGSEEGKSLHQEVLAIAQKAHIRIIGPNTTGITSSESKFCTSFVPIEEVPPGKVAFVAQTGLFLGVLLETILSEEHFGISKVVGLGNKMDVEDSEVLEYLAQDGETEIMCFYIEGLKKARKFYEVAKKVTPKKPVLVVKSGVTGEGSKAAVSHTASLSGNDQLFSAMCQQAGIIRASDLEELVEAAKAFAFQPLPKGKRTALVHYTGAGCVMGADSIVREGLEMASLSEETLAPLRKITPEWHTLRNPVDLWPSIESAGADKAFSTVVKSLIEDDGVDAVVLAVGCMRGFPLEWPEMREFYGKKPVLIAVEGDRELGFSALEKLEAQKFPCFKSVQRAIRALGHMVAYRSHLK
ncbi:MAG: CoA-binding protein [Theionarchaea archaeon]|nr:CoA-binding protein [Theionarchaea archaeon]MBU7037004.1 CoA-binding protein [Theionarchaea archaeon]